MSETTPIKLIGFACPKCKRPLRSVDSALYCSECNRTYPIAGGSSLDSIASFVSETLEGISGSVLDVACGPATYGCRIASPDRSVYHIDFSYVGVNGVAAIEESDDRLTPVRSEGILVLIFADGRG